MDRAEAQKQLERVYADLGDWIYHATPAKARQRAQEYQDDAADLSAESGKDLVVAARVLKLRSKALLLEHGARCLEVLGADVPSPPVEDLPAGVARFQSPTRENIIFHEPIDFDEELEDEEGEVYALKDVTNPIVPKFKVGDRVWRVIDSGDDVAFEECIIVAVDHSFEDVHYSIGEVFDNKTVITGWECVCAVELIDDPDNYQSNSKRIPTKEQKRAHLSLVR